MTMATFVDHYDVLGVKPSANPAAIKKAYRQLALQYHPDKTLSGGKVEEAKFISAQAAYEVLADDTKRKAYDIQYKKRSKSAHVTTFGPKQATHAAWFFQHETDGSYGGGYEPEEMGGEEEDDVDGDYPSDTPTEPGPECQDSGVYEDGYADPHYKPYRTSKDVVYGRFGGYGIYTGPFDSADAQHQFPDDFADDCADSFSHTPCCAHEWDADNEYDRDEDNPAPRISHPLSEAFDAFGNVGKSHYLEEKVSGRYYSKHRTCFFSPFTAPSLPCPGMCQKTLLPRLCIRLLIVKYTTEGALFELKEKNVECDNIDAKLVDIGVRVRRRVSRLPAGSFKSGEFEEALSRKLKAAYGAVGDVRVALETSIRVMRVELQPRSWRLIDKGTWSVIDTIERTETRMEQMKECKKDGLIDGLIDGFFSL